MDALKQFNLAMHYIESHLADEIDFQKVAQLACCSEYHFRRMFASLANLSLSDYIRQRRLSQAALALRHSEARIIDIALSYGYSSADAFSRAFQSLHGVTPSEARLNGTPMKVIPPLTFRLTVQGGGTMEYRIVEKEAFYLVGIYKEVKLIYRGVNPEIDALWRSLSDDDYEMLDSLNDSDPYGIVNASLSLSDDNAEGTLIGNYIGAVTSQPIASERWTSLAVPASTWVVFTSRGKFPDALQDLWGRIYGDWLVTSGYEQVKGPQLVWSGDEDFDEQNFHAEIWIPIVKRVS